MVTGRIILVCRRFFFFLPFSDRKKEFLFRLLYSEQKPYPRRSGIRNVKVYAYHANSYSRKIFEFLGVKNKEKGRSHSSQFKPQQFPGDGGWWSGWQRRRVYCSNHIVSIDSVAVVSLSLSVFIVRYRGAISTATGFSWRSLTRQCRLRRQRTCGNPCTPRYQQPCA